MVVSGMVSESSFFSGANTIFCGKDYSKTRFSEFRAI